MAYRRGGEEREVYAAREVILAGGPINSPQLLKLSGIRPAEELRALGIEVVHELAGVGENLQDHLEFYFQVECREPITLYSAMSPLAKAWIGMRWLLRHDGPGATNHFESCGFVRSRAGVHYPDLQYHFLPLAMTYDGKSLVPGHGFQAHIGPLRSQSRGWMRLASADPTVAPRICFNYMSHPDDWTAMRAAVRPTREIFAQPAFDRYRGREIQPGDAVRTDAEIDAFVREKVESAYHPCGTCRMGAGGRSAGGGRSGVSRDRGRGAASDRFLYHADDHDRQPECPHHHDRRERCRPRARACAAAGSECAGVRRSELADGAAVTALPSGSRGRKPFAAHTASAGVA